MFNKARYLLTPVATAVAMAIVLPQVAFGASQNTNYIYRIPFSGLTSASETGGSSSETGGTSSGTGESSSGTDEHADPSNEECKQCKKAWKEYFDKIGSPVPDHWSDGFVVYGQSIPLPDEPYPASVISGSIKIVVSGLRDIGGLSSLTSVRHDLFLIMDLTNVNGLSRLTSVGGSLLLGTNQLTNVDGLSNLTSVGGLLGLSDNQLTNVDGLSNLTSVGGAIGLSGNPQLTDLSGLSNITSLDENIVFGVRGLTITEPIPSGAWLCQPAQAGKPAGLTQDQACAP